MWKNSYFQNFLQIRSMAECGLVIHVAGPTVAAPLAMHLSSLHMQ